MREVVVFSGSAHTALAHRICDELGVTLSETLISRFSNDCLQAQLLANCRQRDVYLVQPLVPPTQEHLMELLLMIDAARGASAAHDHRGHPALRLRPLRQEGRLPHLARRPSGRRPDLDRRRRPGADDDPARAAGARLLLGAGRPPHRARRARRPLPPAGPRRLRRRLARPRQRQGRDPVLPAARPAASRPASKRRLADDRVVIDSIVGDVAGKRAIVLDDEIATGGSIVELLDRLAEHGVHRGGRRVHARAVRRARPSSGCASTR